MAKAAGISGFKIIQTQPLMCIAIPIADAIFFHGYAILIGNNYIGQTCQSIANVLNIPILYTEMVYNSYLALVINRIIDIFTVLNYTQQVARGPGLDAQEAIKLLWDSDKSSVLGFVKDRIVNWL